MFRHYLDIQELFDVSERGVVVVAYDTYATLSRDLAVKVGDPVEFHQVGREPLSTHVAGIEHCDPWKPTHWFAFLLPRDISKSDLSIGAQIWFDDCSTTS